MSGIFLSNYWLTKGDVHVINMFRFEAGAITPVATNYQISSAAGLSETVCMWEGVKLIIHERGLLNNERKWVHTRDKNMFRLLGVLFIHVHKTLGFPFALPACCKCVIIHAWIPFNEIVHDIFLFKSHKRGTNVYIWLDLIINPLRIQHIPTYIRFKKHTKRILFAVHIFYFSLIWVWSNLVEIRPIFHLVLVSTISMCYKTYVNSVSA